MFHIPREKMDGWEKQERETGPDNMNNMAGSLFNTLLSFSER
jgi:hypothetical protein